MRRRPRPCRASTAPTSMAARSRSRSRNRRARAVASVAAGGGSGGGAGGGGGGGGGDALGGIHGKGILAPGPARRGGGHPQNPGAPRRGIPGWVRGASEPRGRRA